eukprot:jgi/Ulvmu1/3128/UM015_0168.1
MDGERSLLGRYLEIPVNQVQSCLTSVHDSLGLPWWATIIATGIGMRAALLPLSTRASAAAGNFVRTKRIVYQSTYKLLGDSSFNTSQPILDSHGARSSRLIPQIAQRPYSRLWLAAHLLQIPCFVTGAVSVSTLQDPGLMTEGMLWFPDLTKSGFNFHAAFSEVSRGLSTTDLTEEQLLAMQASIAPIGKYGILLPTAYFLLWKQNIRNMVENLSMTYWSLLGRKSAFSRSILQADPAAKVAASRAANLADFLTVAIFPLLISIPHTTLLYFFSSSAFVKVAHLSQRVLHNGAPEGALPQPNNPEIVLTSDRSPEAQEKRIRPAHVSVKKIPQHTSHAGPVDLNKLVDAGIVEYARQNRASALAVLKQAQELCPHHPRLMFAVAQVQRDLCQWKDALSMYRNSLQLEHNDNYTHRARIHCAMSSCFLRLKNRRSALLASIQAVKLDSREPMCWMAKMHAERANGNVGAAIEDAKHIAMLDPDLGRDLSSVLQQLQAGTKSSKQATA